MSGTAEDDLLVWRDGAAGRLRLNRPQALNALTHDQALRIDTTLRGWRDDDTVECVIIDAAGEKAFCAGGDIRTMEDRATVSTRRRLQHSYRWLIPLMTADKPVITAVNGIAAGAGFSLALAGDLVCASHKARFKAGFCGIGAVPDLTLAYTLPRAIGMMRAKDLLLTNREVTAREAYDMGFVSHLAEPGAVLETALATAQGLAAGPTIAFGLTKQLLQRGWEMPLESFLELESTAQATAFASADFAEGIDAFLNKRKAEFKGR